jgi:Protein of unknown function (DUF2380)
MLPLGGDKASAPRSLPTLTADKATAVNTRSCCRDLLKQRLEPPLAKGSGVNVYMEDARTGKPQFVKRVDIRGNSDESWRRGLDYLLRHYLFGEP